MFRFLIVSLGLVGWAVPAAAQSIQVLKVDKKAARGACMINPVKDVATAERVLNAYSAKTKGARSSEKIALANGYAQITALHGGLFQPVVNTHYHFATRKGFSRYAGFHHGHHKIQMNRCFRSGRNCKNNNVAHLMHELGHKLGHAHAPNGQKYYSLYSQHVSSCYPTRYSRSRRNEQFAEVFAAFLTRPEILTKTSECRKALNFFSNVVFPQNGNYSSCSAQKMAQLKQRIGYGKSPRKVASQKPPKVVAKKPTPQPLPAAPKKIPVKKPAYVTASDDHLFDLSSDSQLRTPPAKGHL